MIDKLDDVARLLFCEGANAYSYRAFGCHPIEVNGAKAHRFAVWAPRAKSVSIVGDFCDWVCGVHPMARDAGGIWQGVVTGLENGALYKYCIESEDGEIIYKADPFAFYSELRPGTASRVWDLSGYGWRDEAYLAKRKASSPFQKPISIYEMHLGSWRGEKNYRDIANELAPYLKQMGYTHVEFMPLTEYPFDDSWGYQVTGFFSATARYGTPQDLMYLIDKLHKSGIGVIVDWVPAHFPRDAQGLRRFDGSPCFEHSDPRRSDQPDWGTLLFDFEKGEVVSFLMSSALFWLDVFHVDGLRTDAVSSMLYLNYSKQDGQWLPNEKGSFENLAAIAFLRKTSEMIFRDYPDALFCAEESTSWPLVTRPGYDGGLGFSFKWNMGWMHDVLAYMSMDPYFRAHHQQKLTFSMFYAFSENFILPLSHDEVVHGKLSLLNKMPGGYEAKFANLRVFLSYMFAHPGKKLMFMGAEIGEFIEWRFYEPLEWHLLEYEAHRQLQRFVAALNAFYRKHPALYEIEDEWSGFSWLGLEDPSRSILSLARLSKKRKNGKQQVLVCAFDFTPVPGESYRVGVPFPGHYREVFSTDAAEFGGFGKHNPDLVSEDIVWNHQAQSIVIDIPPLGAVFFEHTPFTAAEKKAMAEPSGQPIARTKPKAPARKAVQAKAETAPSAASKPSASPRKAATSAITPAKPQTRAPKSKHGEEE